MHANTVNKVVRFIIFYANLHKKTDSHTITAVYNDYLHPVSYTHLHRRGRHAKITGDDATVQSPPNGTVQRLS